MTRKERKAYHKGVKAAAEIADTYNSSTTHAFRLGDCIMAKLNQLPKGKRIKPNKDRLRMDQETLSWCLGEVMRLPITDRTLELRDRIRNLIKD